MQKNIFHSTEGSWLHNWFFLLCMIFQRHAMLFLFSSVQFGCSVRFDFATQRTAAHQVSLSITKSWSSLRLMSIESVMPSNHLILCHPLLLPSVFPSIRVFPHESILQIRWPKYWSFSFSISPLSEFIVTHWIPSNE